MSSCSNSSNLSGNVNINNITHSGARLLMTIPLSGFSGGVSGVCPDACHGITAGDAIRYNPLPYDIDTQPSGGKYTKSQANVAQLAEIVGIVESVDTTNDTVEVVLSGQIKYPEHRLVNATHIDPEMGTDGSSIAGASGGNDVYFLSEVTAGVLQNLAPITPGTIAKPILQISPDGEYTGQVVNYIGYQIGGNVVGEEQFGEPAGAQSQQLLFGDDDGSSLLRNGWIDSSKNYWFSLTIEDIDYVGDLYNKSFKAFGVSSGARYKVVLTTPISSAVSTVVGERAVQKDNFGVVVGKYKIVSVNRETNVLWLEGPYSLQNNKKIHIGNVSYDILKSTLTAFTNPKTKELSGNNSSFVDMNNNPLRSAEVSFLKIPADGKGFAVTLVSDVTFNNITVKNQIDVENSAYKITDLTQTVKEIGDTVRSLEEKINNQIPAFTTRITTK